MASRVGADAAGKKFGIPSGTIRSWLRRAAKKADEQFDADALLEEVRREGAEIVRRREAELAAEAGCATPSRWSSRRGRRKAGRRDDVV